MNAPRILVVLTLAIGGLLFTAAPHGGHAAQAAQPADPKPSDYFTPAQIQRSRDYSRPRYVAGIASMLLGLGVAAVIALGPSGRAIGAWAQRSGGGRWPLITLILTAIVTLAPALVTFPLALWRGLYHERRFDLSTQSLGGFIADSVKANAFQIVVTAIAALGFLFIVRRLPRAWPFAAGGFMIALTVALVVVYPLVYEPLFNKFTPVDAATRGRIVGLASEAGVRVDQVLVADASRRTRKLNAYVSGLGATKRVVLYDTLLERSPPEEIDLIVAHELGHVVHRDVARGTALACAGAAGAVALIWLLATKTGLLTRIGSTGPGDPRSLPFYALVMLIATLVTLPIVNGYSRAIEADADRFAIGLTDDAETAVAVEVRLATENVSDLQPPGLIRWVFFTHPATMERIKIALEHPR